MLLAGAAFALMGVMAKLGAQWFTSHELVFYRSLVALAVLLGGMALHRGLRGGQRFFGAHTGLHLRRSLVGFAALSTFFYAVTHLPLSVAITLNYASPLFLALMMPWQLGERPSPAQYATVALGFFGVILLLHPWDSAPDDLLAGLVGLFSGVMAAFAYVHVRRLGRLGEPEWRTVFWFAVVCAVGAAILASLDGGWHVPAALGHVELLLGVGLFATFGQLAMTRAYRKGDTVVVAAFAYSTVVFGSILDALIFNTELPTSAWVGMMITVLAGAGASLRAVRHTNSGQ